MNSDDHLLIATSGGIDSMVLIDLCIKLELNIGIAHLNHNLRGEESIQDQEFIKDFCSENNIPFHVKSIDIAKMIDIEQSNMHELARRERYLFFEDTMASDGYNKVATAHHADDRIEGFFLNLLRGAGLKGLSGMQKERDNIIRPILFADKDSIHFYARNNNIQYREDSSNASVKYSRNYIRHKLMPIIENIKPSYQKTINSSIDKLDDSQQLLQYFIDDISTKYVQVKKGLVTIPLSELINIPGCTTLLYHLIKDYKFTTSQVLSILKAINHTGARFSTSSHQAIIDRTNLLIQESKPELTHEYNLDLLSTVIINGLGTIQCSKYDDSKLHKNIAILDHSKLEFPLRIRKWMPGDKFQPSGMGGKYKKVKKYLTDIKLSRFEKDNIYVLANKNEICWVIGHRVDERYKGNDTMVSITT